MSEPALSFTAFVFSLASTAAIHFGDLPDPVSGQPGVLNLEGAAQMIEILTLLELKTRGNLTAEERQMLEQVLYELRLRFVEANGTAKRIIEP
jgi:3-hydroxymyristoyl/3-hydroxydecanoyl-(acyl carrier protein) dehydratase